MRKNARNLLAGSFTGLLSVLCLTPMQQSSQAHQCGGTYPGARHAPQAAWNYSAAYCEACYAQWPAAGPTDAAALATRCQNTREARYLHFERDPEGRATCIFMPSNAGHGLAQNLVNERAKTDSLLLIEIPQLVRAWTSKCLDEEEANGSSRSRCWRDAAAAAHPFTVELSGPLIDDLRQLKMAWLERAQKVGEAETAAVEAAEHRQTVDVQPATGPGAMPVKKRQTSPARKRKIAATKRIQRTANLKAPRKRKILAQRVKQANLNKSLRKKQYALTAAKRKPAKRTIFTSAKAGDRKPRKTLHLGKVLKCFLAPKSCKAQ
jgi:hypothetical protein